MEVRNLETFIRVAELGSVTKAAEEMGFVQSTVSMQIRQMETELGYPLFDRIGKRVSLTALGEEFLASAYEMVNIMDRAAAKKDSSEMRGTLRIGVLESLLFSGVLGILPEFRSEYPKVDVMIKIGQASDILDTLRQNQLDIAYISYSHNSDPSIICAYSRKEEMAFIASASHPLASRSRLSMEEVMEYPFVVAEKTGRCYGRLVELAAEHNLPLHSSVMVDNIEAITALLMDGQSITFLAEYSLEKEINRGRLVRLDVDCQPQTYYSQILYHKNKYLAPFMQSFIEHIRRYRPEIE